MAGRTSVQTLRRKLRPRRAFTLVEILVVVVIMARLVTVTVTVLGGYMKVYWMNKDQNSASRRAQDVFNILEPAVLYAGLGMPAVNTGNFFNSLAPVASWRSPIVVASCDAAINPDRGNVLKVLYALRSGFKNGDTECKKFCPAPIGTTAVLPLIGSQADFFPGAPYHMPESGYAAAANDMRSYVTFSGAYMHPLRITGYTVTAAAKSLTLINDWRSALSDDVTLPFTKNTIHPYHDMYVVLAGVAFVDSKSVFNFLHIRQSDFGLPSSGFNADALSGFRIEGIRAVRFEKDADNKYLTVRVLAEGDGTASDSANNTASLAASWGLTLERNKYYEEFVRTWRTRNIQ